MNGMIEVGFISDIHLGHLNIAKSRGFDSIDLYHEFVINQWNSVVGKRSIVYIAGDVSMENSKYYHILGRMNGRKIVIGGNHDLKKDTPELLKYVEAIIGCLTYKGYIVTHIPIHPQEVGRFRGNIHGHTHENNVLMWKYPDTSKISTPYIAKELNDKRYINISFDILNGVPIDFKEIISK